MRPTALDETEEEFLLSEECLDRTNLSVEALRDGQSFETALESFDRFLVAKGADTLEKNGRRWRRDHPKKCLVFFS